MSMKDFEVLKQLGKGSFASVLLVRRKEDNQIYALKRVIIEKLKNKLSFYYSIVIFLSDNISVIKAFFHCAKQRILRAEISVIAGVMPNHHTAHADTQSIGGFVIDGLRTVRAIGVGDAVLIVGAVGRAVLRGCASGNTGQGDAVGSAVMGVLQTMKANEAQDNYDKYSELNDKMLKGCGGNEQCEVAVSKYGKNGDWSVADMQEKMATNKKTHDSYATARNIWFGVTAASLVGSIVLFVW